MQHVSVGRLSSARRKSGGFKLQRPELVQPFLGKLPQPRRATFVEQEEHPAAHVTVRLVDAVAQRADQHAAGVSCSTLTRLEQ
jgi:hypothetical protein